MTTIILQDYRGVLCTCQQCGHEWYPRTHHRPFHCPKKCRRSYMWDVPKTMTPPLRPRKKKR